MNKVHLGVGNGLEASCLKILQHDDILFFIDTCLREKYNAVGTSSRGYNNLLKTHAV